LYSYAYSATTGGILLNSTPHKISKEPRPVYAPELDLLGFDKYWKYDKQTNAPYMWSEANRYYYRGRLVASLLGGDVYHAPVIQLAYVCKEWRETSNGKAIEKTICEKPEIGKTFTDKKGNVFTLDKPEHRNAKLRPVDLAAMVEDNREILGWLEETTAKKILAVYEKYADKLDIFHVAFSGGKDSCVLLELVKSVLPHDSFVVVFGDTGMEFPDTYDVIDKVEEQCKEEEIKFYRAASHLSPTESWDLFAPPSRVLRWCCSVHKSTPQTLKLREVTGKQNYIGLAYVGVRAEESINRAEYEYETYGKKQKGQYSHNSILEWTSAEVWLYIYAKNLIINEAYKKGNSRAGCVFCPMSSKTDYLKNLTYETVINSFVNIVKKHYSVENIENGYWCARTNGVLIKGNTEKCVERIENGEYVIQVSNPTTDWKQWIKTLGEIPFKYTIKNINTSYEVRFNSEILKEQSVLVGLFKKIFHKSAYCVGCRVCEANCHNGCISFDGDLSIVGCVHCKECNQLDGGCLVYNSLKYPTTKGEKQMKTSIDCFNTHSPKTEWLQDFFERKEDFIKENTLGPDQKVRFNRFLRSSGLLENDKFSGFAEIMLSLGWNSSTAQGLLLANLAYNPQFNWYINKLDIGRIYDCKDVVAMLKNDGNSEITSKIVATAFKRLVDIPLGTVLHWGQTTEKGKQLETLTRTSCIIGDNRVILYSLYKFAEKCNDYKEFTLNALLSDKIDRNGVSPTRIFGLDRETMIPLLLGLSANNPDFINATFTNDLDKISLRNDKTSEDVLNLFRGN
jgi:phosphoadenosine phosphosulfate reductase